MEPVFSLTETITTMLSLGLELTDVIVVTRNAAWDIRRESELSSLTVGRVADLSILGYRDGAWKLNDGSISYAGKDTN
jgi:predicted amidohydrolase